MIRGGRAAAVGLAVGVLAAAPPEAAAEPRLDYVLHCQGCHRADGAGTPGAVPSLRGEPGRLLGAPGGRAYLVRVPGVAGALLSDAPTAALLNWVLRTFSADTLPADFAPYTAAEVARLRGDPLLDVDAARAALVRELEAVAPR